MVATNLLKRVFRKLAYEIMYAGTTVSGFWLYYFVKRRTIVFIGSAQRVGSTLLKALLAEAPDVSHLPEVSFKDVRLNPYNFYYYCYKMSPKRIIILKKPASIFPEKYPRIDFPFIKLIIVYRHPRTWHRSMRDVFKPWESNLPIVDSTMTDQDMLNYWCKSYEALLDNPKLNGIPRIFVSYEELIAKPVKTTRRVFAFIGSERLDGCDTYHHPENFEWAWGSDDAGEKIKQLRIVPPGKEETVAGAAWENLLAQNARFTALWGRLEGAEDHMRLFA